MRKKVVAIVGPTASGKTGISIELAKRFGGEIISADSMQIYNEMNIGTAKPSVEERNGVYHHLMGHISVEETYSVASYVSEAEHILEEMYARSKVPFICGGTGLYIDHLLGQTDFFDIEQNDEVREKYQRMSAECGAEALHTMLSDIDPLLAEKLHPNDLKRVIRGLEVYEITGKKLSDIQAESKRDSVYDVLWIGLNYRDRSILYDRINKRVDLMMENGLRDEIVGLMAHHSLSKTARAAIGYKEIIDALESGGDLEKAVDLVKQKSRNYAKRQITWFSKNKDVRWFYCDEMSADDLISSAVDLVEEFLKGEGA